MSDGELPGRDDADGDRAYVTKLVGGPGGGKTTTLLGYAEREADAGTAYDGLFYLTFTRAGAAEAGDRLADVYPDPAEGKVRDRTKTVHAAALGACLRHGLIENPKKQVFDASSNPDVYETFCRRHGMSYDPEGGEALRRDMEGYDVEYDGNKFFATNDWLKATRKPYRCFEQAPVSLGADHDTGVRLLEKWDEFKANAARRPLYEHADYVDLAIEERLTPGVSVMLIDEFQDLSPQQYELYKLWRDRDLERLYIAGDANQSIYGFRAARPLYFNETPADEVDWRTKSYRCPSAIAGVGGGVLSVCPETDPNGFEARRDGGTAEYRRIEYADELADAVRAAYDRRADETDDSAVFLLARTNQQVYAIADALSDEGVRYSFLGSKRDPWDDDPENGRPNLPRLYHSLRQIRSSDDPASLPRSALRAVTDRLPGTKGRGAHDVWSDVDGDTLAAVVGKLDLKYYDRERLLNAVHADHHNRPDDVKVGTIHAAKGLEAPTVFLFDAYTANLAENYHTGDAAEEHRLYYVGATRASEELHVVTGFDPLPNRVFPAFDGGLPAPGPASEPTTTDGGEER